jgi:hypothetical protein
VAPLRACLGDYLNLIPAELDEGLRDGVVQNSLRGAGATGLGLGSLVNATGDVGHERGGVFFIGEAADKDDQEEWLWCEDDGGVVMNFGYLAGLVGDGRPSGQAGGDAFVEMLALEDFDHLRRGVFVNRLAVRDGGEKFEERVGGGGVVQSFFESFAVFDTTQDVHAVGVERMNGVTDVVYTEFLDDEVRGEIAADGDHEVAELAEGAGLAAGVVEVGLGVVGGIESVDGAIDEAMEFIFYEERFVESELAFSDLMKELDHDRNFHGAGGVEGIGVVRGIFEAAVKGAEGKADVGAALANFAFDAGDDLRIESANLRGDPH